MTQTPSYGGPCLNTDKELWREREGDYYADSIHVTEGGGIGMNCGGCVIVQPIRKWHEAARDLAVANERAERYREALEKIMHARVNTKSPVTNMSRACMRDIAGDALEAASLNERRYREALQRVVTHAACDHDGMT